MADPTTTPAPSVGRAAFTFILIMVAFDFLAFGIIAPVQFEGGDFARASSIGGCFGLAWATMQFIFPRFLVRGRIVSGAAR
jgi:DHA1 family tetracycline resistance protein-like MFS transporter